MATTPRPHTTYTNHEYAKPAEKLVNTYVGLLAEKTVLPGLFSRKGVDEYKDVEGETVTMKVPGRLPARRYEFRNERLNPIKFDVYKERKVTATFGDHIYSGVKITDEQTDFDNTNPQGLMPIQAQAIAAELNHICGDVVEAADYPVQIGGAAFDMRRALLEARKVMNKLRLPEDQRYMVVGSDFENELLLDEKMNFASTGGEQIAFQALRTATLGERFGFTFVRDDTIDPKAAYAFVSSAFVLITGVPNIPQSVPIGATTSYEGLALRWLRDYDLEYMTDRSVLDTYCGTEVVEDVFLNWDNSELADDSTVITKTRKGEVVGEEQHFVRGIKLSLDGESDGPAANSALATDTGLVGADIWEGTAPETTP